MKMGRGEGAVATSDKAVRRYRTSDRLDLRREVALALELKAMRAPRKMPGPLKLRRS